MVANQYDWDWAKTEESFKKALSLNPNLADAHTQYAWFLAMMGRFKEAVTEAATACELDPMSPFTLMMSGWNEMIAREYSRARVLLRRALELAPDFVGAHSSLGLLSAAEGRFEDAVREADEAVRLSNEAWFVESQAAVYAMAGLKKEAKEILEGLLTKKFPGYAAASMIGAIYYLLGEKDTGWEWMQKAYEARDTFLVMWNNTSMMKAAREDPRFLDLLKRLGLGQTAQSTS
jgi:tetratricopeptide (TPR) repeat protein